MMSALSVSTCRLAPMSSRSGYSTPTVVSPSSLDGRPEDHTTPGGPQPTAGLPGKRSQFTLVAPGVNAAIRRGLFRQVRFLVQFGADVDERDADGRTPLMHCALIDSEAWGVGLARLLVEKGASIGTPDRNKLNALHYATIYNRPGLVEVFLGAADFDLNQADKLGNTALHYAVLVGDAAVTARLLSALRRYQLPLNVANKRKVTPLMQAQRRSDADPATLLVLQQANPPEPGSPSSGGDGDDAAGDDVDDDGEGGGSDDTNRMSNFEILDIERNKACLGLEMTGPIATHSTPTPTPRVMRPPGGDRRPASVKPWNGPSSAHGSQRHHPRPCSAQVLSKAGRPATTIPRYQQGGRRWRQNAGETDPEMDIINQPRHTERLYHVAKESELRNRPEIVFNMNPIECILQGTSTHPQIARRHPPGTPTDACARPPPPYHPPSSWRSQMNKLYGAFQFQFTPSYVAGVKPLPPEPEPEPELETEPDSDDASSFRPGSVFQSEDMSGAVSTSDITSTCSKHSAGRRSAGFRCTVDAKWRRQAAVSSAKKRQVTALLTLRGDSDTSSTDTNASASSSRRRKNSSTHSSSNASECSTTASTKAGKARVAKFFESMQAVSKFKDATQNK